MRLLLLAVLVILLHPNHSTPMPSSECFLPGAQYAGVALNTPEEDHTPSPEACQLFCHTVFDCVAFSWVDDSYSLEELRLSCTLWGEVMVVLVDEHFVSGPRNC